MPTLEERVAALEAQTPRRSYTSMWSGEEIDRRLLNAAGRNLLDNSWWARKEAIVNQRGQLEYRGNGYTIDRWTLFALSDSAGRIIITDDGIILDSVSGYFQQRFEYSFFSHLIGSIVTISALIDDQLYTSSGQWVRGTNSVICPIPFGVIFLFASNDKCEIDFSLQKANATHKTKAVKFEPGPTQSLAHKDAAGNWVLNDPPPDYGLELLKCQRYQVIETRAMNGIMGRTDADDKNMTLFVPVPVCMRANPLVTIPKLIVTGNGKAKSYLNISKSGSAMPAGINFPTTVTESAGIGAFQTIFCYMPEGYTIDANL